MASVARGCAACTIASDTPDGPSMKRVCVDGQVFDARAVYPA
jgi:dihydroorotate dehydrogenase electron transfer subunit